MKANYHNKAILEANESKDPDKEITFVVFDQVEKTFPFKEGERRFTGRYSKKAKEAARVAKVWEQIKKRGR